MIVNKNTWHYRFIADSPFNPATNFCKYFWQAPAILTIYIGMILLFILSCIFILSPWIALVIAWYSGDPLMWIFGEPLAVMSLIVQLIGFSLFISIFSVNKYKEWKYSLPEKPPSEPKPPGLIKTYYKAWKEKYCPTLEFTYIDDNSNIT